MNSLRLWSVVLAAAWFLAGFAAGDRNFWNRGNTRRTRKQRDGCRDAVVSGDAVHDSMVIGTECSDAGFDHDLGLSRSVLDITTGRHDLLAERAGHVLGVDESLAFDVPEVTRVEIHLSA